MSPTLPIKEKFAGFSGEKKREGLDSARLQFDISIGYPALYAPLGTPVEGYYPQQVVDNLLDRLSGQIDLTKTYEHELYSTRRLLVGRVSAICEGEPIIMGTRISVANIIERYSLGWNIEKILSNYPHLDKRHIVASLEYYDEHKAEIDALIEAEKGMDEE